MFQAPQLGGQDLAKMRAIRSPPENGGQLMNTGISSSDQATDWQCFMVAVAARCAVDLSKRSAGNLLCVHVSACFLSKGRHDHRSSTRCYDPAKD